MINNDAMKRFSCLKAALAAAAAMMAASCQQDNLTPELSFDKTEFEVPATGGKVEVTYSISNPVSGAEWSYTCDSEWVEDCDFTTEGVIAVTVSPNYVEEERSAVVTFVYSALDKEFPVTLVQQPGSPLMPSVVFDPAVAEVAAEGGSVTVSYTVENPVAGESLSGTADAEWITDLDTSVDGKVSFNVSLSYVEEERTADIKFEYADMEFVLPVVQAVGNPDDAFDISIVDVGYMSSVARVVPADSVMTYMVLNDQAWYFDQYDNNIEDLVDRTITDYMSIAGILGMSFEDFMEEQVLSQRSYYFFFENMMFPDTDYTVWVMGMKSDGTTTTKAFFEDYRTLAPELVDITFEVDVNLYSYKNVAVTYTPSVDSQKYLCDIYPAEDLSDPENVTRNDIQNIINTLIWQGGVSGKTPEDVIAEVCETGECTKTFATQSNTGYVAWACAVDESGVVLSEPSFTNFKTYEIEPSDNTFDITVTPGYVTVTLDIVPSNNTDEYTAIIADAALIGDMTTEEFAAKRAQDILAYSNATSGPSTIVLTNKTFIQPLTSGMDYSVFVFGFAEGIVTTDVTRLEVTTVPCEDPSTLEFDFKVNELYSDGVNGNLTVNQQSSLYIVGYVYESETSEDVTRKIDQYAARMMTDLFESKGEFVQYYGMRGDISTENVTVYYLLEGGYGDSNLTPDTAYKLFAVGVDDKTGEYATPVYFSEPFTTLGASAKSMPSPRDNVSEKILTMRTMEEKKEVNATKNSHPELSSLLGRLPEKIKM